MQTPSKVMSSSSPPGWLVPPPGGESFDSDSAPADRQDQPHRTVGARLREARERQGVSLSEVAASTKVSVSVLTALERDDVSRVPGGVFARGYVRSYAAAVKLDPETTVAEFVAQSPVGSVQAGYPAATVQDDLPALKPSAASMRIDRGRTFKRLGLAGLGVVMAASLLYVGIARPWSTGSPATGNTDVRTSSPGPSTSAPAAQAVVETPSVAAPAGSAESAVGGRDETIAPPAPVPSRLAVVLSVTNQSWVIVTVDGEKVISRMFQVGDQETLDARHDLVVTVADAGALVMHLNGAPARALGGPHETVTARITRENVRDYLRPDNSSRVVP